MTKIVILVTHYANFRIHTDSLKQNIVPKLTEKQKKYVYAEEVDVLNVALFGIAQNLQKINIYDILNMSKKFA